jgi:hypothetical protein
VATPTALAAVATAGTAISLTDIDSVGSGDIITDAERTKLTDIEAGAEVNVNADWDATTGDAEILNKPTLVEDIDDLADVTITTPSEGQLLYYDGAEWINKTVVGGNAVASVSWTNATTITDIGTWPNSMTDVAYPASATVTPAGSFSISYNSGTGTLSIAGLSTGTVLSYSATFMVTPAAAGDFIVGQLRAELSESVVFGDTTEIQSQTVPGLPVGEESQIQLDSQLIIGSHTEVQIFIEVGSFFGVGTARCKDFEITIT